MGWAQRRKNRVDRHREHLLAECRAHLEFELSSFSARGASPITCDAELDSPASLAAQDFPDVQDACDQDTPDPPACLRRFVRVCAVCAGLRKVCSRFTQGLRMVYARFTHCLRVVYAWFAQGLRKVCARFAQGLRKVCARFTHGLRMVCARVLMVCAGLRRFAQRLCLRRFSQGLRKDYARFTPGLRQFAQSSFCLRNLVICVNLEEVYAGLRMVYAGLRI